MQGTLRVRRQLPVVMYARQRLRTRKAGAEDGAAQDDSGVVGRKGEGAVRAEVRRGQLAGRDEGIVFAVGDFLSSCEMTESDWDFAKREGIVAEVNWWLNQQEEGR